MLLPLRNGIYDNDATSEVLVTGNLVFDPLLDLLAEQTGI